MLHGHFSDGRHEVPNPPEGLHLTGSAERDADVFVENRIFRTDENIVFLEVLDDFVWRAHRIHHDEIGLRINGAEHARIDLVHELLAVVGIALEAEVDVVDVVERGRSSAGGDDTDAPAWEAGGKTLGYSRRCDGIANAHAGEAVDFGEGARDDNARIVYRAVEKGFVCPDWRDKVMIGLVDEHGDVCRQFVDER